VIIVIFGYKSIFFPLSLIFTSTFIFFSFNFIFTSRFFFFLLLLLSKWTFSNSNRLIMYCSYNFVSYLKFTFFYMWVYIYFPKMCWLINCFSLYFSCSLYIYTEYCTRKYCMCVFTHSLYYHCRLIKGTIKIFIIQDCPFSPLWTENELVLCHLSNILVNISHTHVLMNLAVQFQCSLCSYFTIFPLHIILSFSVYPP
jgi:hypothetical protein